jgi:hypothetical protein
MAFAMEGGIGADAVPRLNAWGRRFIIVWGDEINDKKNKKIYYVVALNGHQSGEKDATINKKRALSTRGGWNMMCERRGAWGGGESIVFMATM